MWSQEHIIYKLITMYFLPLVGCKINWNMLRTCHKEDFFVCLPFHSCALSECFTPMSLMLSNNFCGESLPIFVGSVSCRKRHNNLDNEMCLKRYQNIVPPDKEYHSAYVRIYLLSNVILFIHAIIAVTFVEIHIYCCWKFGWKYKFTIVIILGRHSINIWRLKSINKRD